MLLPKHKRLRHYGHPSKFGYKDLCALWKAENFDPDALMDKYYKAGARYFMSLLTFNQNRKQKKHLSRVIFTDYCHVNNKKRQILLPPFLPIIFYKLKDSAPSDFSEVKFL